MAKARKKSAERYEIIAETSVEAITRLMEEYGFEAGDYRSLALRLAIDYKPGFPKFKLKHGTYGKVMRDKGGRKTYWTPEKLDELVTDVDRVKKKYGFSGDDDAIRHLTKAGKWGRQSGRDLEKWRKTLKNTLAQARKTDRLLAQSRKLNSRC